MNVEKRTIIACHGWLAEGFKSSLNLIVGEIPNLQTLNCFVTPEFDIEKSVEKIFSEPDIKNFDIYVFTDIMGGSVNNAFVKQLEKNSFHLFTNINLAMLIDHFLSHEDAEKLFEKIEKGEFRQIFCNHLLHDSSKWSVDDI